MKKIRNTIVCTCILCLFIFMFILIQYNNKKRTESMHLSVGDFVEDLSLDIRMGYGNGLPYQITFAFPVVVVNEGTKPIALMNYSLMPINCEYEYTFRGQDGDQGLYVSPADENQIGLPITLASGEARKLFIKTAIVVPYDVSEIAFDLGPKATIQDLFIRNLLFENGPSFDAKGIDLFGNEVEYDVGMRGLLDWEHVTPDKIKQPVYQITFQTYRGNIFTERFAPYGVENTFPISHDCPQESFDKRTQLQITGVDDIRQEETRLFRSALGKK